MLSSLAPQATAKTSKSPARLTVYLLLVYAIFCCTQARAWQLEIAEPNLKVWTQAVSHSEFKSFKGTVLIKAPITEVMAFIKDTPNMVNWYHNTIEARRLQKIGEKTWLSYSVTQAPWPVTDRDSVTIVEQQDLAQGYRLTMQAAPERYPLQANRIRIPKLDGFWLIEKLDANLTQVTLQISAEPGGEIPSWLANALVIDMPYYSLSALKTQIEKNNDE
ncbi:START domain-containing protein [Thiomicrorhabdus sediminis]|uniref:START domain-containing protein n=1 Tax=Thiomicrorhabdus sediminis TaxID=2580412 RepID=A0A4P9K5D2_9GAMM|nr:START domain-containing protein [Thiomicrorhabdus sediminis]QCU90205.1 hypothetical protein FE785_05960 [Thiomicrorhabdus sediminis]